MGKCIQLSATILHSREIFKSRIFSVQIPLLSTNPSLILGHLLQLTQQCDCTQTHFTCCTALILADQVSLPPSSSSCACFSTILVIEYTYTHLHEYSLFLELELDF